MKNKLAAVILFGVLSACGGGSSPSGPSASAPTATPTPAAVWQVKGEGIRVFTMPAVVRKLAVDATFAGNSSNFIVHVAGVGLVNELLGTGWGKTTFHAEYLASGAVADKTVETLFCDGVSWQFTELR